MVNKYKKEIEDINRRVYGNKTIKDLKRIAKKPKHGLLNVDHYTNTNKNELVERLVKGTQLRDISKGALLEQGKNAGLKVNVSMSKETIIKTLANPKFTDYTKDKLTDIARKRGLLLPSQITGNQIIERLKNPSAFYTVNSLKELLKNNNVETRGIKDKPTLINLAEERGLLLKPLKTEEIQESNLWVSVKNIPEALKRVVKKKARNAREAVADFKEYIKNLKKDYLTPSRLKKLSQQLEKKINKAEEEEERLFTPVREKSALNDHVANYVITGDPLYAPSEFLHISKPHVIKVMASNLNTKTKLYLNCLMKRADPEGTIIKKFKFHSIGYEIITESTDLHEIYNKWVNEIEEEIQKVEQAEGSGWVFVEVENLTLYVDTWDPLKASSYIRLPKELKDKKAIVNMQNEDNKCFLWCVLRALNPINKNAERIDGDLKSKENTVNMEGINYPVDLKSIKRFENQNPDISISVLGYNKIEKVYPLHISRYEKVERKYERKYKIVLLLIKDEEGNSHYCYVKNVSALLTTQLNKHKGKLIYCLNCFKGCETIEKLDKHKEYCSENGSAKPKMPAPETFIKFVNYLHGERAPFVVYADFESMLKPLDACKPDPNKSYTHKYQKHEPLSCSYYMKSFDESVYKSTLRFYTKENEEDPDPIDVFISWLESDVNIISNLGNEPMRITEEEEEKFNQASNCWICGQLLNLEDRVRDHCHYTGQYRGAAHNRCNLKYRKPNNISVFFHNLSGYDSHLLIKKLNSVTEGYIDCIPNNQENYITFSKTIKIGEYKNKKGEIKDKNFKIIFKDSFKFMASSLEALVNNLTEEDFKNLEKYFTSKEVKLLKQKGFFPYDYLDDTEKLKDTEPPPQWAFYSKLTGRGINNYNYRHVKNVWKTRKMKTLKDYLETYNTTDVLLLADVFEKFRDICLKNYGLDPVYYFTAPGLAWDAMLKMTKINLELLSDYDMLLMIEKGIRGGISIISNRYGKANNKYMKDYDKKELLKYLMYVDANNLYGFAMSEKLPVRGFKWMTNREIENIFNNQIVQVWERLPCILEVDLEYPEELHDLHNDYPLCPERVECNNGV